MKLSKIFLLLIYLTALAPSILQAQSTSPSLKENRLGSDEAVTINFVDADIEAVIKAVGEIAQKNFLIDPRVKGKINIVSSKAVNRSLVYPLFLSALRLHGYAAVDEGVVVKIVPETDAKLQAGSSIRAARSISSIGDQIQTQVFILKHESAAQIVPVIKPLVSPNNSVMAYSGSNAIIVTDYVTNLSRIERILDAIDQPSGTDPIAIPLKNASAIDVAQTINYLFAGASQADPNQRVTVIADQRSNSVLAVSESVAKITRIRGLVAMMDLPTSADGNIHVVPMKNAEAIKVAETLRAIYYSSPGATNNSTLSNRSQTSGLNNGSVPGTVSQNTLSTAAVNRNSASMMGGIIQADSATNSVIITASDTVYRNIRGVLDKLDVRRAQVYVEALVAEVSADKVVEFGVQWQDVTAAGANQSRLFGGTNFGSGGQNIVGVSANPAAVGKGLNIGIMRGRVTIPGAGEIVNLGMLARALETQGNANILSTPTLLTLDNEEAKITIGQNVPFITGQYSVPGGVTTPIPFQTIERRDVGLTLRIKPQISEGGSVRMQIFQEASSVQDSTNTSGIITNKRSVESTVLIDEGQVVAIGGLMQDTLKVNTEKVPLLGDIPLLGNLFQYKSQGRSKTNLMVFIRPTILRDAKGAKSLYQEKYDFYKGLQNELQNPISRSPSDKVKPAPVDAIENQ